MVMTGLISFMGFYAPLVSFCTTRLLSADLASSLLEYAHLLHLSLYIFNGIATLSFETSIPLFLSF